MNCSFRLFALMLLLGGCSATTPRHINSVADNGSIAAFSAAHGDLPSQWAPLILVRSKKPTQYQLVSDEDTRVLYARAEVASSGLMQKVNIDPIASPWLHWRWKIGQPVDTVDPQKNATEDSPARVILGFDGDKEVLPFADQVLFDTAKLFTGHDFPYATLMYIWDRHTPVGTIMPSYRSARVKMIVVANENTGIKQWHMFHRNIVDDFHAAFGEPPGKLIGVGVLTDTDNLGEAVDAWYGDIRLHAKRP